MTGRSLFGEAAFFLLCKAAVQGGCARQLCKASTPCTALPVASGNSGAGTVYTNASLKTRLPLDVIFVLTMSFTMQFEN